MWKKSLILLAFGVSLQSSDVTSFVVVMPASSSRRVVDSSLLAVRQPRRNLKKRKGRERKSPTSDFSMDNINRQGHQNDPNNVYETKPLIAAKRKEAGEDFWIDPKDLKRETERQQAIANRKAGEQEMPQAKLREEVVAPYTQNWIGIISVGFVVLAAIIQQFPQVLENPIIGFPDLEAGDPIPLSSSVTTSAVELFAATDNAWTHTFLP